MRAGTQTLIQALQALPLMDDQENDDEFMSSSISPPDSESDDEGKHGASLLPSVHFPTHNDSQQRLWRPLSTRSIVLWPVLVEGNQSITCSQLTIRQRVIQIHLQARKGCRGQ
jgi:hypothetical protein